jgi:hypothetical protein
VPVWGWRKDKVTNTSIQAPKGTGKVALMNYTTSDASAQTQRVEGESISYGAVLHTPKAWREKIGGTNISLIYNTSENFKADAPRGDLFGNQIANPSGETEDYGVAITTLNDRLTLKVTHYETKVKDATLTARRVPVSATTSISAGRSRIGVSLMRWPQLRARRIRTLTLGHGTMLRPIRMGRLIGPGSLRSPRTSFRTSRSISAFVTSTAWGWRFRVSARVPRQAIGLPRARAM